MQKEITKYRKKERTKGIHIKINKFNSKSERKTERKKGRKEERQKERKS